MDFGVLVDRRVKLKESKTRYKYWNIARELNKLWNMKVMVIPIVTGALGTVTIENYSLILMSPQELPEHVEPSTFEYFRVLSLGWKCSKSMLMLNFFRPHFSNAGIIGFPEKFW